MRLILFTIPLALLFPFESEGQQSFDSVPLFGQLLNAPRFGGENPALHAPFRMFLRAGNHFSIPDLNSLSLAYSTRGEKGQFKGGLSSFGIPGFRYTGISLAYSLPVGELSRSGAMLGLAQTGRGLTALAALGYQWHISSSQWLGLSTQIPLSASSSVIYSGLRSHIRLEHSYSWAGRYQIYSTLTMESHQMIRPETILSASYESVELAFGISLSPWISGFAIAYRRNQFRSGMSLSYTPGLGYSPSIILLW